MLSSRLSQAIRSTGNVSVVRSALNIQRRQQSSDRQNPADEIDMSEKNRIPFLSILDALGSGRRGNSRYDRRPSPSSLPKDAFPPVPRKQAKDSGPFAAYAGRTKLVENGNIAQAFRSLNLVIRQNKVAKEYKDQKFYEKPSNKRVRLNRVRHRARFLSGVKRLVNLVKEQRKYM